ncbi:MAG: nucleoside-diphosphate kinase [Patescibacteria group bacterium]
MKFQRTLVLLKPDALQRNLLGEIISRFEKKGLKIIGLKMIHLSDALLDEHYIQHKDKPFFGTLKNFMKSSPVVAMALEGIDAVAVVRIMCGKTQGREADMGTIRGDFSISGQATIVHASDALDTAERELKIFFKQEEIFEYKKLDFEATYGEEERADLEL